MKLKICGIREQIQQVADLQPDYMGFIFWAGSPRYFFGDIPELNDAIQKVGVFVNEDIEQVIHNTRQYKLQTIQLHGNESPAYCQKLRQKLNTHFNENTLNRIEPQERKFVKIIKAFSVQDDFDFSQLKSYEASCDYYLFDTKGEQPGGNGRVFNWQLLQAYPSQKSFFLSGGIGLEQLPQIHEFLLEPVAQYCHAVDVNSRFEIAPGLKNLNQLQEFKRRLPNNTR